jgi:hypothetical protein
VIHGSVAENIIMLMKSSHITTRFEAYEIMKELSQRATLQDTIMKSLVIIIKSVISEDALGNLGGSSGLLVQNAYAQQALAIKLAGIMAVTKSDLASRLLDMQLVPGLLSCLACRSSPNVQKNSTEVLQYLCSQYPWVSKTMAEHLGDRMFELFMKKPESFFMEMTIGQMGQLKRNSTVSSNSRFGSVDMSAAAPEIVIKQPQESLSEEEERYSSIDSQL